MSVNVKGFVGRRRAALAAVVSLIAVVGASGTAWAQSYASEWVVPEGGVVKATLRAGGAKYIGGQFDYVGPNTGGAALLSAASVSPPTGAPHFDGTVAAIAVDPNGGWWIGGTFTSVGTLTASNLVHLDANGNVSSGFLPNPNGPVLALAADANFVYVGGTFSSIAAGTRSNFARLTSATNAATLDNSLVADTDAGLPGTVRALLLDATAGVAYMGGDFTHAGGSVHERVAQMTMGAGPGLTTWRSGNGAGANNTVYALAPHAGSGSAVFVGGAFTTFGSSNRNRICKVQTTGALSSWTEGTNGIVYALATDTTNATMFMGGAFTTVEGTNRQHLARVDQTGTGALMNWNPGAQNGANPVMSLTLINANRWLYVGGDFTQIDGLTDRRGLARVAVDGSHSGIPNGTADAAWKVLASKTVLAIAGNSAGNDGLYVGGVFQSVGGQRHVNVARLVFNQTNNSWDADSGWAAEVGTTTDPTDSVDALTSVDTTLYVGGSFGQVTVGGTSWTRGNACNLAFSGTTLGNWNPFPNGAVHSLYAAGGGLMYLGGRFDTVNYYPNTAYTRPNVVRVDTNYGLVDASFNCTVADASGSTAVATVWALANGGGGAVILGGEFGQVGGQSRASLAKVDSAGAVLSWDAKLAKSGGSFVYALAQSPAGTTLFVGGSFSQVNSGLGTQAYRENVAEIGYSDAVVTGWMAGNDANYPGVDGPVHALATVASSNAVYVGGGFLHVASTLRVRAALVDATTGAVSTRWNPAFGPSSGSQTDVVYSISADANSVDVGGAFGTTSSSGSTGTTPTLIRRSLGLLTPAN